MLFLWMISSDPTNPSSSLNTLLDFPYKAITLLCFMHLQALKRSHLLCKTCLLWMCCSGTPQYALLLTKVRCSTCDHESLASKRIQQAAD